MLTLQGRVQNGFCDGLSRRDFLKIGGLALGGWSLPQILEAEARAQIRERQQAALKSGDEKYLPVRDRGPVRRFIRDYIDRRYVVAEYLLPILILSFIVTSFPPPWNSIGVLVWLAVTVLTIIDETLLVRRIKKEVRRRFPDEPAKGVTMYILLRSTQLRRFRLPKPQIKRGEPLPERY